MAIGTILFSVSSTLYHRKLLFSAFAALLLVVGKPRPAHSLPLKLKTSTISAAPGILPYDPKFSSLAPALAPDVMPVFPTPGGSAAAPPAGSLPTIPSSPSPPNPDELQPNSATAPSGSAALTSAAARSRGSLGGVSVAMVAGLLLMWWLDVVGKWFPALPLCDYFRLYYSWWSSSFHTACGLSWIWSHWPHKLLENRWWNDVLSFTDHISLLSFTHSIACCWHNPPCSSLIVTETLAQSLSSLCYRINQ